MSPPQRTAPHRPVLITGGAGFVGCNLADRIARQGRPVLIYDNLSRPNVEQNLAWLLDRHGNLVTHAHADMRDRVSLRAAVAEAAEVFHFAAQVAVTTSLTDPEADFEINARGTLNLLEAVRAQPQPPSLVFASTNKVYGHLPNIGIVERQSRYEAVDAEINENGISERQPLSFYSPYGCSKGAADQYVLDYARVYGLPTAVFRMSCLYGPRQFGTEDQGWVAHFVIAALQGQPITIYGDGKQVRDVLFVEDVVDAFLLAQKHMPAIRGQAFNIGGGPRHAVSLLELIALIAKLNKGAPQTAFSQWRPGDQRYYVSDTRSFREATGWWPAIDVTTGVRHLFRWMQEHVAPARVEPLSEKIRA